MDTIRTNTLIFGPIKSRRLGNSLGINLLASGDKFCNFDCLYCECGWTHNKVKMTKNLADPSELVEQLLETAQRIRDRKIEVDYITFAGNGEPTLHPKFEQIMSDVILVRDLLLPETKISVLTNATMLHKPGVRQALSKTDVCMFKLDAGTEELFRKINQPLGGITIQKIKSHLVHYRGAVSIQTLFFKGEHNGDYIDNTTDEELEAWKNHLLDIKPKQVVLYSLDRPTPEKNLVAIPRTELLRIADLLKPYHIETLVV